MKFTSILVDIFLNEARLGKDALAITLEYTDKFNDYIHSRDPKYKTDIKTIRELYKKKYELEKKVASPAAQTAQVKSTYEKSLRVVKKQLAEKSTSLKTNISKKYLLSVFEKLSTSKIKLDFKSTSEVRFTIDEESDPNRINLSEGNIRGYIGIKITNENEYPFYRLGYNIDYKSTEIIYDHPTLGDLVLVGKDEELFKTTSRVKNDEKRIASSKFAYNAEIAYHASVSLAENIYGSVNFFKKQWSNFKAIKTLEDPEIAKKASIDDLKKTSNSLLEEIAKYLVGSANVNITKTKVDWDKVLTESDYNATSTSTVSSPEDPITKKGNYIRGVKGSIITNLVFNKDKTLNKEESKVYLYGIQINPFGDREG